MGANASTQFGPMMDSKSSVDTAHLSSCSSTLGPTSYNDSSASSIGSIFAKDKKLKRLKQKIMTKLKKSSNQSQVFKDFSNFLNIHELALIYEEYRSSFFMKELSLHALNARPMASSIRNDLSELYDLKHNSDITLVYKGVDFPVHKALVCVRCPFFRELLKKKQPGNVVQVDLDIRGLRVELFNDLLKYLYSGELAGSYDPRSNSASYEALIRISQECGVPNPLSHDLKYLLETGIYSDASLCFQPSSNTTKSCVCLEQTEFSCHQAILSARSPFFRNVILRNQRRNVTLKKDNNVLNERIKIVLDESILPRRFARILLHVMYRDSENLLSLIQSSICKCKFVSSSKDNNLIIVKEIMDLYEIARFLEIDILVQSCEDMIVEFLNLDTLILILKWSEQPHGSPWVKRQALCFLIEYFSAVISTTSILYQLDYSHFIEILKLDFLEASELDILKAVIKWGEHYLIKQIEEEREPNLISSHNLTRKGFRKKEVDDDKLRDLIHELVCLIRIGHILPHDSEYLNLVTKRSLVELPQFMFEKFNTRDSIFAAWFRKPSNAYFVKPRFFSVYFEECKSILEERIGCHFSLDESIENYLVPNPINLAVPDNLYMIEKLDVPEANNEFSSNQMPNFHFCFTSSSTSSMVCYDEIGKPHPNLPVLEERILLLMRQREQELRTSPFCIRALKIAHNRCEALRLIQLRVVREFGLPDIACEVLHLRNVSRCSNVHQIQDINENYNDQTNKNSDRMLPPPPRPINKTSFNNISNQFDPFSYDSEMKLEELTSQYDFETQFSSTESCRTLNVEMMPDISFTAKEV